MPKRSTVFPVVIYNVPGRTSSNISAETTLRLARDVENIVAVKEASGNLSQIMEILRGRPENFRVISGDDAFTLAMIALGAEGLISVASNEAPDLMSQLNDQALAGNWDEARALHYKLLPLMEANFIESSPGPVKAALAMMGLIEEKLRLPLVPVQEKTRARLREILDRNWSTEGKFACRCVNRSKRSLHAQTQTRRNFTPADRAVFDEFKSALNRGEVRAAERNSGGEWLVHTWVKQGLLLGFRMGVLTDMSEGNSFKFFDKDTYPGAADNDR